MVSEYYASNLKNLKYNVSRSC